MEKYDALAVQTPVVPLSLLEKDGMRRGHEGRANIEGWHGERTESEGWGISGQR